MLPWNTKTKSFYIPSNSPGDYIIDTTINENNPATVVGFVFMQGNVASEMDLMSGSHLIFRNFAKDTSYIESNYTATGTLKLTKTGNDEAFFLVNYVPQEIATTTTFGAKISQGDLLIAFFLFVMILGSIFGFLVKRFILRI